MNREQLSTKLSAAATECLAAKGYIAPVDGLLTIDLLTRDDHERWRRREVPYLERVVRGSLPRMSSLLRTLTTNCRRGNMRPSWTAYVSWGKGHRDPLRFSKSGNPPQPAPSGTSSRSSRLEHPRPPTAGESPCEAGMPLENRLSLSPMTQRPNIPAAAMLPAPRRSACAAVSRAREMERIRRLSVHQRIVAALTIGARFSWLKPEPQTTRP